MKYYITYTLPLNNKSSYIFSSIIDFKYYVSDAKDVDYLKTELLNVLKDISKEIKRDITKNVHIVNFYLLNNEAKKPTLNNYFITVSASITLKDGGMYNKILSETISIYNNLETAEDFKELEKQLEEEIKNNNSEVDFASVAIINYIQLS